MNEQARPKAPARRITRPRKARPIPRNLQYRLQPMCAPGQSVPIASARGGAEDAGAHTAGTQGAGQHRSSYRAGMADVPQAGIGGSDVAAILGISPFRTARDLYDDKLNIASAVDDAGNWVALEMGHLLEPLVAQIFTKKPD